MASRIAAQQSNLDRYHCLFTWYKGFDRFDSTWMINTLEDKLMTSDCEWQSIVYHLVLAFENYNFNQASSARDHLVECENILSDSECIATSPLVNRNMDAIKHVLYSTWLHMIAKDHSYDDFEDYLKEIKLYKAMDSKQRAGVNALKAACLMEYGLNTSKKAREAISDALSYNEHEGHWHYLKGQILKYARLSNNIVFNESPSAKEEKRSFEMACFYDEHIPSHSIGLAECLYDSVNHIKGPSEVRDKATQLYKGALENWPHSAYVNLMCTSGLLAYSYPVRDTRLADKCLAKALNLAPLSSHINLVAGVFFKYPNHNDVAANRNFNVAKKRFSNLVDSIRKEEFNNYRDILVKAITDPPQLPPAPVAPTFTPNSDEDIDIPEDPDDEYIINYLY
ncbi:30S ribosomal protein S4 [Frankliniella fusca]|uniref:30S ribosomal protein S4 n=1 Tax=Frankliniella fusca TaxID=407009 RepID=A0AAE1LUD7_9NEOP|nr:30S ribosomal protein S4 [Frankliniella fusca]